MIKIILPNKEHLGPIRAVLFDKDGTLIDSHSYWGEIIVQRAHEIISYYQLPDDKYLGICESMGLCSKSLRLTEKGPVALESRSVVVSHVVGHLQDIGVISSDRQVNQIFDKVSYEMNIKTLPRIQPIRTAISTMSDLLRLVVKLAIVTSDTESNALSFIRQTGFSESQIVIIGRDSCPHSKKTGFPAKYAASKLGVDISQCIVIGDAPMDHQMAVNSGALHLLVSTGQLSYETLRESTPLVVNSLTEITFSPLVQNV